MSGKQAANSAQQSANNAQQSADAAQQAANQAQQKADQSGSAADQKAADAAQQAANQAQQAADAAQQAANEAKSAANSGNNQEARDKAKEAANAADAAQQGQQSAEQNAGTGGQNGQQDINNMSGQEAANSAQQSAQQAQQSADQAQQAANSAQQKAGQSGDAADQAAADSAQRAADAAQSAADAAKQAASQAQQAAQQGNDAQARKKAKEAQSAAQQAQQMASQAQQQAGQGQQGQGQQMIPPSPKPMTKGSQEMDSTQTGSKANNVGQEGDKVWKVSVGKKWGQNDLISKEEGMKISEEEGNPYTSEEYNKTPEEHAREVIEHHDQEIRNIGKGTNASMDRKMDKINEILAPPVINWKTLLYKLFKNAGVKQEEDWKMKKSRFGGGFVRPDRFEKITPKKREELSKNSADIFYLIDSSGSISKRDLYRAFSEIIALETRDEMNIRKSALTYFACDFDENRIRVWFRDDSKKKKMELVQYEDGKDVGGGTEIAKSVVHVTKLPKKFYSRANPRTLIIVFTDGEDYEWEPIKNLPEDIKKRTVFVILNKADRFEDIVKNILACGVLEKYVVCVDTVSDLHN